MSAIIKKTLKWKNGLKREELTFCKLQPRNVEK